MENDFSGTGFALPVALDGGNLRYESEELKVQQSILCILGTRRGERVMRPDFGSRLHDLVFEPINSSTKSRISRYVIEALVTWESRIEVLRVDVSDAQANAGRLLVGIEYRVRATNSRYNLVYPFYLAEGSGEGA